MMRVKTGQSILRSIGKIVLFLVLYIVVFVGAGFIGFELGRRQAINDVKTMTLSGLSYRGKINDQDKEYIKNLLRPFDVDVVSNTYSDKRLIVQYNLKGVAECFVNNPLNKGKLLFDKFTELLKDKRFNWNTLHVSKHGFYEDDRCFAIYLNPEIGFHLENIEEAANFSEMLIRLIFSDYIQVRKSYKPSENVKVIPFSKTHKYKAEAEILFGIYDLSEEKIYLNSDSKAAKVDIGWRLIHEMLHSFASPQIRSQRLTVSRTGYSALEETLTESLIDYIVFKLEGQGSDSPATAALLTKVDKTTLIDVYFNGNFVDLKDIIDTKTYDGSLCTFWFYLDKTDLYGHTESDIYLKSLNDSTLRVPNYLCTFE